MSKSKILLAEDDTNLGLLLKEYLIAKEYDTTLCEDGDKAYDEFLKNPYDLCIFDVMMPNRDGFTLAKDIRSINSEIPIIFLTAKSMKEDVLEGFKIGADDYMTKPFSMEELIVRIEAVLRRSGANSTEIQTEVFKLGKFVFDSKKQLLTYEEDKVIKLTTKESELLKLLCNNANKVLERNLALKTIWIDDNYFNARSMDVYITKLRKHLKPDSSIEIINVHGKGYKLIV
ncbi:MAG: response regulator transcription factor [Marinifilaceae bacterium]|jgi:DNA-binding response OmpR family regulator|nr:response regulator transcription factor [Marinifilaceae bacterium]